MSTYQVKLEIFEGPLDLLLYLIKKEDMDIRDILISEITQEYLSYITLIKELNLEMAGEFLVMASTLLEIKAKMLLPKESTSDEAEQGPDPRADLVAKLLEYQKFKEAALMLAQREHASREIYYRNVLPTFSENDFTLEATLFDLLDAFKNVLKETSEEIKELIYEEIPLEQKIREILDMLEDVKCIRFEQIFSAGQSRRELIYGFLALLELIRLKQVIARQSKSLGEIWIYAIRENSKKEESDGKTTEIKQDENG